MEMETRDGVPFGLRDDIDQRVVVEADFPIELPIPLNTGNRHHVAEIVERDCPACGCNRAEHHGDEMAGVHSVLCSACEYVHHQG